jgi:membrane protease YdiL (CAAX protease family)
MNMDFTAFRDMKPFAQLMFSIFIMVASVFLLMIVGLVFAIPFYGLNGLLAALNGVQQDASANVNFLKYMQVLQSVGLFVAPPFILGLLYHGNVKEYLLIDRTTKVRSFVLAVFCLLAIVPLINFLGDLNSKMSLPSSLSGLENWMRSMEDNAKVLIDKFMEVDGLWGLLFNVFMIAVLPAIGEELMFRGVVQRIFTTWTKNYHWGIWITAFLFSAMHMQFYGFLPRMVLGAMFGYLLVWTGTMWVPILAHFFNNLVGVLGYFLIGKGTISKDVEQFGTEPDDVFIVIISVVMVSWLLFLIRKGEQPGRKMPVNQEDSQA